MWEKLREDVRNLKIALSYLEKVGGKCRDEEGYNMIDLRDPWGKVAYQIMVVEKFLERNT